jgi:hypothetical protein
MRALKLSAAAIAFALAAASAGAHSTDSPAVSASTTAAKAAKPTVNRGCRTRKCGIRVARKRCDRGRLGSCIRRAALQHRVSESYMRSIIWCESTNRPGAVNGIYAGLAQFGPNAWSRTPYRRHSRHSSKWATLGLAYALKRGRAGEWDCAY